MRADNASEIVIACTSCGVRNRLQANSRTNNPKCGSCGTPLGQPTERKSLTSLQTNPFWILRATTRDDSRKIIALAEENLTLDSETCTKARSDLTTPLKRLAMEMAWLPGVSPKRTCILVESLHNHIDLLRTDTAIPALAKANLFAAAFELFDSRVDANSWCEWIIDFAEHVEMIDAEDILRDINEDRAVSRFPMVQLEQIESRIEERRRYYTDTVVKSLECFDLPTRADIVTRVVETATYCGEDHAPQLIHDLVDRYETDANQYLHPEEENIQNLIGMIKDAAPKGEIAVARLVNRLEEAARNWDAIAQPIQLSMKAQGLDHKLSHQIAWNMRELAIYLFNKQDMLIAANHLTNILQDLFAELPEFAQQIEDDKNTLTEIQDKKLIEELISEANDLKIIIQDIEDSATENEEEDFVIDLIDSLEDSLNEWSLACDQTKSDVNERALIDKVRQEVAWAIRSLAITLVNEHDLLDVARRLTILLQHTFSDLPPVIKRLEEDIDALDNIARKRTERESRENEWAREITYQAEIGVLFKDELRISPDGVEWKGKRMSLEAITRVRWGATQHSVNGIPAGTDYMVAVGSNNTEFVIETKKERIYDAFVERLWKAVCDRLIIESLQALKDGEKLTFGPTVIDDNGIQLIKHKFIGSEKIYMEWNQVTYSSYNGSLFITAQSDKKTYVSLPYLTIPNAHILEAIIRLSFKNWKGCLSGLLSG